VQALATRRARVSGCLAEVIQWIQSVRAISVMSDQQRPRFRAAASAFRRSAGTVVPVPQAELQRYLVACVCARSFAQLLVHSEPVASLAVWLERGSKGKPLMVPSTVVMPARGAALASFGRVRKVKSRPSRSPPAGRVSL